MDSYTPNEVREDGTTVWRRNGELHREAGPAIIRPNGMQEWLQDGHYHRDDGPARIWPNGAEWWYRHGVKHREGGPAVINPKGPWGYYKRVYRPNYWIHYKGRKNPIDKNAVWERGLEEWWQEDQLHREDGPALILGSRDLWYRRDVLHRVDGPAVVDHYFGSKFFWFGKEVDEVVHTWLADNDFPAREEWDIEHVGMFKIWATKFPAHVNGLMRKALDIG